MKILTLNLNPALDLHCSAEAFEAFRENFAKVDSLEAGGKGMNVARALNTLGIECEALSVLGDENASQYETILKKDQIHGQMLYVPGRIRENITLHSNGLETRISFDGFSVERTLIRDIRKYTAILEKGDVLTWTGSNPQGLDLSDCVALCRELKERGVRLVIDSRSFGLSELAEIKPWLIKPNEGETEAFVGMKIGGVEDAVNAAQALRKLGIANVIVSLGERGAVLACEEGIFRAVAPKVRVISTIGAGDSMIAGFIAGAYKKKKVTEEFAFAVAAGSAKCLCEGTKPPKMPDVVELLAQVTVS